MFNLKGNQEKDLKELMQIIAQLKDEEECLSFFVDLCTVQELLQLSNRLQIAKGLLYGQTSPVIRSRVPVSTSTVTRVKTVLHYGTGGLRKVLERLKHNERIAMKKSS